MRYFLLTTKNDSTTTGLSALQYYYWRRKRMLPLNISLLYLHLESTSCHEPVTLGHTFQRSRIRLVLAVQSIHLSILTLQYVFDGDGADGYHERKSCQRRSTGDVLGCIGFGEEVGGEEVRGVGESVDEGESGRSLDPRSRDGRRQPGEREVERAVRS